MTYRLLIVHRPTRTVSYVCPISLFSSRLLVSRRSGLSSYDIIISILYYIKLYILACHDSLITVRPGRRLLHAFAVFTYAFVAHRAESAKNYSLKAFCTSMSVSVSVSHTRTKRARRCLPLTASIALCVLSESRSTAV